MLDSFLFSIVLARVASLFLFFLVGLFLAAMTIDTEAQCYSHSLMCHRSLGRVLGAGRHDAGCTGAQKLTYYYVVGVLPACFS